MSGLKTPKVQQGMSRGKRILVTTGKRKDDPKITKSQVQQMIKSSLFENAERKYVDATTLSLSTVTSTMSTTNMTAISAGTSVNGRVGESIVAERLDMRLAFITGDATNLIRLMVVVDKQTDGALFSQTDLFENAADPLSPINYQSVQRFSIPYDEVLSLDTYNPQKTVLISIPLHVLTRYNGTGNAIGNIVTNSIHVVMVSDSGAVPQPTVSGNIRLIFRDS